VFELALGTSAVCCRDEILPAWTSLRYQFLSLTHPSSSWTWEKRRIYDSSPSPHLFSPLVHYQLDPLQHRFIYR